MIFTTEISEVHTRLTGGCKQNSSTFSWLKRGGGVDLGIEWPLSGSLQYTNCLYNSGRSIFDLNKFMLKKSSNVGVCENISYGPGK